MPQDISSSGSTTEALVGVVHCLALVWPLYIYIESIEIYDAICIICVRVVVYPAGRS